VLDVPLPAGLPRATLYGRWGDWLFLVLIFVTGGIGIGWARRR